MSDKLITEDVPLPDGLIMRYVKPEEWAFGIWQPNAINRMVDLQKCLNETVERSRERWQREFELREDE